MSEGPELLGQVRGEPISTGLVPGHAGLPVAGAIGSASTDSGGSSLLLRRVREPDGVTGTIAGIPAKMKA